MKGKIDNEGVDSAFVNGFAGVLVRDLAHFSDPAYSLSHKTGCPLIAGTGPCSCGPDEVEARADLLGLLARFVLDQANTIPYRSARGHRRCGRPPKYSPALALRLCLLQLMAGKSEDQALRLCGISLSTLKRWRRRNYYLDRIIRAIHGIQRDSLVAIRKRVLSHGNRASCGTLSARKRAPAGPSRDLFRYKRELPKRRSRFRPEFASRIAPSFRKTAKAIGVSPSTVYRWTKSHVLEFGLPYRICHYEARLQVFKKRQEQKASMR
jgi:hypothetical protein